MTVKPLIFFVHVPKTAGSTVNRMLERFDANGRAHCEALLKQPDKMREAAETLTWMSGHIGLTGAREKVVEVTDRPVRLFTCMRNPTAQVMSHYNWLIEIFNKGERFYERHSDRIKEISATLRAADNNDPATVIANLEVFNQLFLNFQSRPVLGRGFNWNKDSLIERLDAYEFIASEATLGDLFETMTGTRPEEEVFENTSRYNFDKAVFSTPEVRDFLRRNNTLDEILYGIVTGRAGI